MKQYRSDTKTLGTIFVYTLTCKLTPEPCVKGARSMQKANKSFLIVGFIFILGLALFGSNGCSKSPTAIAVDDSGEVQLLGRNIAAAKLYDDSYYVEQTVSAKEGGRVNLLDVILEFPPGALNSDTLISIEIPNPSIYADHFGTDGLVFNSPVKITMSYRDAILDNVSESTIKMAWFNEKTDSWETIKCFLNPEEKTVTAYVSHFSAYALITDE